MSFWEAKGMTMDLSDEEVVDTLNNLMERNRELEAERDALRETITTAFFAQYRHQQDQILEDAIEGFKDDE